MRDKSEDVIALRAIFKPDRRHNDRNINLYRLCLITAITKHNQLVITTSHLFKKSVYANISTLIYRASALRTFLEVLFSALVIKLIPILKLLEDISFALATREGQKTKVEKSSKPISLALTPIREANSSLVSVILIKL